MSFPFDYFRYEEIISIITSLIVVAALFIIEKIFKKLITRFSERAGLKKHLENILSLVSRIVIYSAGIAIIFGIWGLPTEWFVGVSALSGAAIGFASTQTIGNLLAGFYIMVTKPFEVDDYVMIGSSEGEVREITLNYVKIFTPTYKTIEIPNRVILNSIIIRCMSGDSIDYSFTMSFAGKVYTASWVPLTDLLEKIVEPAIDDFWLKYEKDLSKKPESLPKPEASVSDIAYVSRTLMIRMFIPKGKVDMLYCLRPELQKMILERLDDFRSKNAV